MHNWNAATNSLSLHFLQKVLCTGSYGFDVYRWTVRMASVIF